VTGNRKTGEEEDGNGEIGMEEVPASPARNGRSKKNSG
jgi:hypothetical protein